MQREKALAKNTAILMFGKICTQCISFLLLPLYTSVLDTAEYGTFDIMITYSMLVLPIVNLQFDQGLFRFMLEHRGKNNKITNIFSSIFLSCIIQTAAYNVLLIILNFIHPVENIQFLMIYVSLQVFVSIMLQFSRGLGKSTCYAIASFISAVSTVVFNVIALVFLNKGVYGLFAASILGQVVTIIYLSFNNKIWKYVSIHEFKFSTIKEVSQYSLPLIPNNLAWWVVNVSDRLVIKYFLGIASNGIFTVASKFPNVFINFYNIVNLSWTESVSLHFTDEDRDVFLSEMMTVFFKLFSTCCFLIISLMPFVFPVLVNWKYKESYNQIYILMMAMLFRVMVGLYSCVYIAEKKSKKVATTSITAAVINLTLDILLMRKIGLYAASVSSLIAFMSMFVIRYFDINRSIRMKIESKTLFLALTLGVLLGIIYYSENIVIQFIGFIIVCIYSILTNKDLIKIILEYIVKFFRQIKRKSN